MSIEEEEKEGEEVVERKEGGGIFKASFISTISKFSGERSGRIGLNIPASIKSSFPVGIRVKVMVEEIREGPIESED